MSAENVELARRGYRAALRGDYEAISELLAPDVQWHGGDPSAAGSCHNREQALRFMRGAFAQPPFDELVDVVDAGDKVVVIFRSHGSETPVANVSTFRDGKVVEMVHYPDVDEALAAAPRAD